jgi:hypothetical protein
MQEGVDAHPESRAPAGSGAPATPWARRGLLIALLLLALAARLGAVHRANVSWDEFGLAHLADASAATGELHSAARPGLGVWLLVPLVRDCTDEISVIREARLLWTGITALFLVGLALWIGALEPDGSPRGRAGLLGVALLALAPAFLASSLQVRTDQIALAGGAFGGYWLLASRRRPWLALAAGACFGAGFLGSQKLLYLLALALLLAAGQLRLERELAPRREAARALLAATGFAAVLLAFQAAASAAFAVPERHAARNALSPEYVEIGFSLFDFYRNTIGFREYREMLPTLAPQLLALLALAAATPAAVRGGGRGAERVLLAWAVLGLGTAVGLFHAAAFRYFWMTLGVFPAVAICLGREAIVARLARGGPRLLPAVAIAFAAMLAIPAALETALLLRDTQAVQRESLAFVHRHFDRSDAGFQPESALFCQAGRQPIPTHFSQKIYQRFAGPGREANTERMLRTFRRTPIKFIVQSFRLNQFPVELRRFWAENYQPYRASVFVAGRRLSGARGGEASFELFVPGRYRWIPRGGPHPLAIGGRVLRAGEVVELGAGAHVARFPEDVSDGMLVLAVGEPPGEAPLPFYAGG